MRKKRSVRCRLAALLLGALLLGACGFSGGGIHPAERTEAPALSPAPMQAAADNTGKEAPAAATEAPEAAAAEEPEPLPTEPPNTRSLGDRLEGKYACRLEEEGLADYFILEIFNVAGNLYAQAGEAIADSDEDELAPYSFWAMELIPREADAFLRTDIDECEVGLLSFSVMSNLGEYWGEPRLCTLRLTVDGVSFLGPGDRPQPLTGSGPRLELLRDERVEDCFPPLERVLMEGRGISIPAGLSGLWVLEEDIPLCLEFTVDGTFRFWQKNPGKKVLLRRGAYTFSAPGELSGLFCQLGNGTTDISWTQGFRLEEEGTRLVLLPTAEEERLLTRDGPAVFRRVTEETLNLPLAVLADSSSAQEGRTVESEAGPRALLPQSLDPADYPDPFQ